jgi:hypothetical protein
METGYSLRGGRSVPECPQNVLDNFKKTSLVCNRKIQGLLGNVN